MKLKALVMLAAALLAASGSSLLQAQTTPAPQPSICNRACWTARNGTCTTTMAALTRAIIHHTASQSTFSTTSLEQSKGFVRGHQNGHMDVNGWCDIGYHFLVDALGNIFEGRKNSMTTLIKGTHAGCGNTDTFGFSFMGYFHSPYYQDPPVAMRSAMYDVIAWRMPAGWTPYGNRTTYSGSLNGTAAAVDYHKWVGASGTSGCASTSCPGDIIINNYITQNFFGGDMRTGIANRRTPTPPPPVPGHKAAYFNAGNWFQRNTHTTGGADSSYWYGASGDIPIMGDWDGNGTRTPGVYRNGQVFLSNDTSGNTHYSYWFGQAGDIPVVGDWDGNGTETLGLYRNTQWFLSNDHAGTTHHNFWFGDAGDKPLAGKWDGTGGAWVGVFRPSNATFYLGRNGGPTTSVIYGLSTDTPVVGDWDNNGTHTVGVVRSGTWYLRNSNTAGNADITFTFNGSSGYAVGVWR